MPRDFKKDSISEKIEWGAFKLAKDEELTKIFLDILKSKKCSMRIRRIR
jgi:hypothetical protein